MDWRTNAGYIIANSITIGNTEVVLGVHSEYPNKFVTWECKNKNDYYWGHYHTDILQAQKDFLQRGLAAVHNIEPQKNKPKNHGKER